MEGAAAVAMHLAYEVKIADWRDAETGLCVVEQSLGVGFEGRHSKLMAYAGRGLYRAHTSSLGIWGRTRRSDLSPLQRLFWHFSGASFFYFPVFPLSTYRPRHYYKKLFKKLIPAVPPLVKILLG